MMRSSSSVIRVIRASEVRMAMVVLIAMLWGPRVAGKFQTPLPASRPLVLAGQSNALFMRPYLEDAYKPGSVVGFAQDGSHISEWGADGPHWKALRVTLHHPIRAFVWWQGESDAATASRYLDALREFIARVRYEANDPNLLVVICRVVDDPAPGWSTIRRAQETFVATDRRAALVSSDGLPKEHPQWKSGSAHLSKGGYQAMARRIIAALPQP
jgi:hypothetical protein